MTCKERDKAVNTLVSSKSGTYDTKDTPFVLASCIVGIIKNSLQQAVLDYSSCPPAVGLHSPSLLLVAQRCVVHIRECELGTKMIAVQRNPPWHAGRCHPCAGAALFYSG